MKLFMIFEIWGRIPFYMSFSRSLVSEIADILMTESTEDWETQIVMELRRVSRKARLVSVRLHRIELGVSMWLSNLHSASLFRWERTP